MFSNRVKWDVSSNKISSLLHKKLEQGEEINDLTESNPTKCGFPYPENEIIKALSDKSILQYAPEPRGNPSARRAISNYYQTRGIEINPDNIIITASTSEAYTFIFKLLCNAGDEILAPCPSYPLFEHLSQINDIRLLRYNLFYDFEWHIDVSSIETAITDRTKSIILLHPNNPTGSYVRQDEFKQICKIANMKDIAIIVDEVFYSFNLETGCEPTNLFKYHPKLIFTLNGISKLLALPQLKISWIVVSGEPEYAQSALEKLDIISDCYLSANTPSLLALPRLMSACLQLRNSIMERLKTNYQFLKESLISSRITPYNVEGGWYAPIKLPRIHNDEDWAMKILDQHNVFVHPGYFFDFMDNTTIVVCMLKEKDAFKDGISIIKEMAG